MDKKNAWVKYPRGEKRSEVFAFAEGYRKFISECKTERECANELYKQAIAAGFKDLEQLIEEKSSLKAGDRIVTSGLQKVIPGRAVRIVEKNTESAPTTETKKKNLFDKLIKK